MAADDSWLAAQQQWIRCGHFLVISHRVNGYFDDAGYTPEGCSSISSCWHSFASASVKTAAAGRCSGMLNTSLQAWSLSTAAEPKCNSRLFSAGLNARMFSRFQVSVEAQCCNAQNTCLIIWYTHSSCRMCFTFFHVVKDLTQRILTITESNYM